MTSPSFCFLSFIVASLEIPEAELVKDLVFISQGIEGKWIRFDASKDAYKADKQVCGFYVSLVP